MAASRDLRWLPSRPFRGWFSGKVDGLESVDGHEHDVGIEAVSSGQKPDILDSTELRVQESTRIDDRR